VFVDLYPTPHTGARLRATDKKDWMGVKGDESRFVRCRFCGWICDRDRDLIVKDGSFAGRGTAYGAQKSATYTVGGVSVTDYYYEPSIQGGCPCCGSYRYADKR
jgi:hypothetical protein